MVYTDYDRVLRLKRCERGCIWCGWHSWLRSVKAALTLGAVGGYRDAAFSADMSASEEYADRSSWARLIGREGRDNGPGEEAPSLVPHG